MILFAIIVAYVLFNFFYAKKASDAGAYFPEVALDFFFGVFVALFKLIKKLIKK